MTTGLVEHFFRREYGRLVATLSRRVGVHDVEAVEDAVQEALLTALERWPADGVPDDPSAWLFHVARNAWLQDRRKRSNRLRILETKVAPEAAEPPPVEPYEAGDVEDDLLRMLFCCCDPAIPVQSQLVLAMKTLCGFGVHEIALRLFTSEANVYKRLGRARARLRELAPPFGDLAPGDYSSRLEAVHGILYLLFTEGYLSSHERVAVRRELCDEAIRLGTVLADHPVGRGAETAALLALMHLQSARLAGRRDAAGDLLLLEEQDRSLWDQSQIKVGLTWLARATRGEVFSRYHGEAAIAAEHCLAASAEETRWSKIAEIYALLEKVDPSSVYRLNRAVAVAEWQGPEAGLAVLADATPPIWLTASYQWSAVLADLHRRRGNQDEARRYFDLAIAAAPTDAIRRLLVRRRDRTSPD